MRNINFLYSVIFTLVSCAHAVSSKETRERIAIIDTGLSLAYIHEFNDYLCNDGHLSLVKDEKWLVDTHGHGTNIYSIIAPAIDPKTQCIVVIKYISPGKTSASEVIENEVKAILHAINLKAKYLNFSSEGPQDDFKERIVIERALKSGMKITVAAGNDGFDFSKRECLTFPACYEFNTDNFRTVGAYNSNIKSNINGPVRFYESGSGGRPKMKGTSQASAQHMAKWIFEDRKNKELKNGINARKQANTGK